MQQQQAEGLHVLIIGRTDAPDGYAASLCAKGFRVTEAHDSDEGIAAAIAFTPDLIVLDFDLDGATVTARLRANLSTHSIPVIALAHPKPALLRQRYATHTA
jgi:DNA-binding response OmpR family regulator